MTIIISNISCITRIGFIYNVTYISNMNYTILSYQTSCSECICYALFSLYVGLNCYKNNKTCFLLTNYSLTSNIINNINSTFIFIQQPLLLTNISTNDLIKFPLNGETIAGYGNGTSGNDLNGLSNPWGLALSINDELFISDYGNNRIIKIKENNLTGSIVAGIGIQGNNTNQLNNPTEIYVDKFLNIYIADSLNYRIIQWLTNTSNGIVIAGNGISGSSLSMISTSFGMIIDSQENIYVSEYNNHRITKWTRNATSGILVAGISGSAANSNRQLNRPSGIYLDEINSYLYIADSNNHRIQRYHLDITNNGTTVAGGNGQGDDNDQLNQPYDVYVSKITGDIYIADKNNHRIQRWSPGATSGVTIAGITGVIGSNATLLYSPCNVILNINETFLYVSDMNNHRVQRFKL